MAARRRHFGSLRRLPSGRWQCVYWHLGGRHVAPGTFPTKADALVWLSATEADIHRGLWVPPAGGRVTVAELARRWLEADPGKRANTRTRDDLVIRVHILPTLGEARLDQISQPDVQRLVNRWAKERAPRTVRRDYAVLRAIFGYAVASDWLARSPCREIKLPAMDATERRQITPDEVSAIAEAVGSHYAPMVWLGALLGLRWGEVAGLKVGSLDIMRGTLQVVEQRPAHGPPGPPKSRAGRRPLSLPSPLVEMLSEHLASVGLTAADADHLVFTTPEGAPLDYSNWRRRVWLQAVNRAGITGTGFHDLRRTNATQLVVAGVDVKTAQARLGHSDPRLTLAVYAQAVSEADRDAAQRLGERFFGPMPGRRSPRQRSS